MKIQILSTALLVAFSSPALAAGSHTGGHSHTEMMQEMMIGMPGDASMVTRTIDVTMKEADDGDMIFEPSALEIQTGETILFAVKNAGELEHEFVLDTIKENAMHKAMMEKFPEMEHDDPNAIRLEPGHSGEVIWTFTNGGTFEFACLIPGHYELGMKGDVVVVDAGDKADVEYTKGVVKKVDAKSGKVTIIHEELTSLGMPAMTMVFRVSDDAMLEKMNKGDEIEFIADRVKGKLTVTQIK